MITYGLEGFECIFVLGAISSCAGASRCRTNMARIRQPRPDTTAKAECEYGTYKTTNAR